MTVWYQSRVPVIQFHSSTARATVLDVSSGYAYQSSRRLVKKARARSFGQEDLERRFRNGFLDDSKDRPCITAISRCTRICTGDDTFAMLQLTCLSERVYGLLLPVNQSRTVEA
ncbi:hypothetical protein TIFTF001_044541 [Ficus carica]|uniref:Uncharacterized protein n=1 Tax=Ficus carica TaxID=3494 RepID=A0AA88CV67_FICCA|nr:hypothetical protein TIFTF001_044541 [Ficus carica]